MTRPFEVLSISTRISTEEDKANLVPHDHTKLSAINTCPTWGIIRYSLHKTMGGHGREMPLEAGIAAHDAFAAMNWWYEARVSKNDNLHYSEGHRIFGEERLSTMVHTGKSTATDTTNLINFCLEAIHTSDFFDDPSDRNRTISNISEGVIAFIHKYDPKKYELWHSATQIGIECVFDIVVSIEYKEYDSWQTKDIRLTGKMDALKRNIKQNRLEIHDYKTGYRLDNAWLAQWVMSHQFTGYCAAGTTFTGEDCNHGRVIGMQLPIGKSPADGIKEEDVPRNELKYDKWAQWLVETVEMDERYKEYPLDAPRYTHSCNRYFRPCSFLPLCDAVDGEEQQAILDEMGIQEWSPLHDSS
jgi:hypothetical protein